MSLYLGLSLFGLLVTVGAAVALVLAIVRDRKRGELRQQIRSQVQGTFRPQKILTLAEFGLVERDFPNLTEVIIVCHMVEDPKASLREAVLDNFQEGVRYHFCVSQSNYKAAERIYTGYFHAIFEIAKRECGSKPNAEICGVDFEALFKISPLRSEWTAWPYVFYIHVDDNGQTGISGFRGNQENEGIAEHYVRLRPTETKSILNAVKMAVANDHRLIDELFDAADFTIVDNQVEAA